MAEICIGIPPGLCLIAHKLIFDTADETSPEFHSAPSNIHRLEVLDLICSATCLATRRSQETSWLSSVFAAGRGLVSFTLSRRSCNTALGIWSAVGGSFPVGQLDFFASLIKYGNRSAKTDHALVLLALHITFLLSLSYSVPVTLAC
jgi:hypothetical protein